MPNTKYLDICTTDGRVLVTLLVVARDGNKPQERPPQKPSNGGEKMTPEEKMTEPQQRKLFRLLAERGIEGDKAHAELKKRFHVADLNDVSKREASRMIAKMLEEAKGGKQ